MTDPSAGTTQAWALDDGGLLGSSNLPNAQGLGVFAGSGDFDGDGHADVAWSNSSNATVTLWLTLTSAPKAVNVDKALPAFSTVVSGNTGSDDSEFRQRFCSGDLNGNGLVNSVDFKRLTMCVGKPPTGKCALADMDSDGQITLEGDFPILQLRIEGKTCTPW
jgi:hypothetical protein